MPKRRKNAPEEQITIHPPRRKVETPPMLINDISHLFHSIMRAAHTEGILTQHSARMILAELSRNEGMRQTDLVRATHMKAPTVSVIIKKMAHEGLLTHEVQFSDLRAVRLHLTDKGREMEEITRAQLQKTDDLLMDGFSEEEAELLRSLLLRMRENTLQHLIAQGKMKSPDPKPNDDAYGGVDPCIEK